MTDVRPFCGIRYNQDLIKNIAKVVCPPYDIITPQILQDLYQRSEYNFVRLECNRELPQDNTEDNKYTRSAATLQQWLHQGILKPDKMPTLYYHKHHFTYRGMEYQRRGIIALVHLEEWEKMVVRPHENTFSKPKVDRLNLLRALHANTSSVLALFEDWEKKVFSILVSAENTQPIISFSDVDGDSHNVWAITKPKVVERICDSLAQSPLYIADGHHRYESALNYRCESRPKSTTASVDEVFDFVMMTLVDFADPGLLILPTHRLLRGISRAILEGLEEELKIYFEIEKLSLDTPSLWQQMDDLSVLGEPKLALAGLSAEYLLMLKVADFGMVSKLIPSSHSEYYKRLDASIVDHVILEKLLGLNCDDEEIIAYSHDREDAVKRVLEKEYQLAFLLSPAGTSTIKNIVDMSDRMPRKSTYFYPKAPAGLVFYKEL